MTKVLSLHVGARLWLDGEVWSVSEHVGDGVRLTAGQRARFIRSADLIDAACSADDDPETDAYRDELPGSVTLSAVPAQQRRRAESQAAVIGPLVRGLSHGQKDAAMRAAATELGVSVRTVQRMIDRYRNDGVAGLLDSRMLRTTRTSVDPAWDAICRETLASYRDRSNPTIKTVIKHANDAYLAAFPDRTPPKRSVAYVRVRELDKGRYTFGAAKQRRSVADRPEGVLGRLSAQRPGQFVVMDTTRLDVHAMEPVSLRWVNTELTVAMDVYSRCVTGVSLRPVAATSVDAASVLHQTVTPQQWGRAANAPVGPYVGVPENIWSETGIVPDTVIVDHGKIYLSRHLLSVCDRLGINVQPAIPHKPTDKPWIERFFLTLRHGLLEHLPAYKGPDVASRGRNVEDEAFLYVPELEQLIREWVGVYHATPHDGLCDPRLPDVQLSPREMFERGVAISGALRLPATADVAMEFLETHWRKIHHYGVELLGRRYDGPALNPYRGMKSTYGGEHTGAWPFMVNRDDVRSVFFKDPADGVWHRLEWEHAAALDAPFSAEAADFTRRLSVQQQRFVDPDEALGALLADWAHGEVTERRDRNLAIRLSAQRAAATTGQSPGDDPTQDPRDRASVPGVIDLFAKQQAKTASKNTASGGDLDVFDEYYQKHPDGGLEVLE
ncbi:helix-turn-helix domain-containing protein [Flexivirga lutea]